jgi:hypothetical protein
MQVAGAGCSGQLRGHAKGPMGKGASPGSVEHRDVFTWNSTVEMRVKVTINWYTVFGLDQKENKGGRLWSAGKRASFGSTQAESDLGHWFPNACKIVLLIVEKESLEDLRQADVVTDSNESISPVLPG